MSADQGPSSTGALPRVRRIAIALAALLGMTVLMPTVPADAAPANSWSTPSGGNGNQRNNAGEVTVTARNAARVTTAWATSNANLGGEQTPTVVGGVVYYIHRAVSVTDWNTLVAASARTGKTLWQVHLSLRPNSMILDSGVTVAGSRVLVPYWDPTDEVGLIAVDMTRHAVAWTSTTTRNAGWSYSKHHVYADASRAYVNLAGVTLAAYRLSDGRLLWTVPLASPYRVGVALGSGLVYVGYDDVPGITAYDSATGRKMWTAPGGGTPVVAGGRVFSKPTDFWVNAVNAAGCGKATCPALWTRKFPVGTDGELEVGGADGTSLFVSYQRLDPGDRDYTAVLVRLSAATGSQLWTRTLGDYFGPPVRGGGVLWIFNSYVATDGRSRTRIVGFAASGSRTTPLCEIPVSQVGTPQSIAIGGGTLLYKTHIAAQLIGFRVPGT